MNGSRTWPQVALRVSAAVLRDPGSPPRYGSLVAPGGSERSPIRRIRHDRAIEAVKEDDLECVEILLNAGADVETNSNGTALSRRSSAKIGILRLLDAGANPADATSEPSWNSRLPQMRLSQGSRRTSFGARSTVGSAPRILSGCVYHSGEAMIRCGVSVYEARYRFERGRTVPEPVRFGLHP